jgi:arylsulfatase A-like enzyme
LEKDLPLRCEQVDQASAALVKDLKRSGLLDDTLVIWGGEFGRTPMGETRETYTGRDHHVDAFTMWMAGGGIKPGIVYGKTDEIGLSVVENRVHVHDLQATILHLLGLDHKRLTFRFQGRDFRLTDVHGKVVREVLA